MTHGSGFFGFESLVVAALTVLVVVTLTVFAHAAMNPAVVG